MLLMAIRATAATGEKGNKRHGDHKYHNCTHRDQDKVKVAKAVDHPGDRKRHRHAEKPPQSTDQTNLAGRHPQRIIKIDVAERNHDPHAAGLNCSHDENNHNQTDDGPPLNSRSRLLKFSGVRVADLLPLGDQLEHQDRGQDDHHTDPHRPLKNQGIGLRQSRPSAEPFGQ